MRLWGDVYDASGDKLGMVQTFMSASASDQLDGVGTFDATFMLDENSLNLLQNDREVRIYYQQNEETPRELVRGLIRDRSGEEQETGTRFAVRGSDTLDALTERTVGLGRSYEGATISTIVQSLVGLVPGWSASVAAAVASDLQTARFDGAHVLKAIIRLVEERGIHFRRGTEQNTLEVGAFGEAVRVDGVRLRAIKPPSVVTQEMRRNPAIMLIDRIRQTAQSNDVINWAIPLGAGQGASAFTLKHTTARILNEDGSTYRAGWTPEYPVYRRVNSGGLEEYYVDASAGSRIRQKVVTFKAIGPVSNGSAANEAASDALLKACTEFLRRQRETLVSYRISARDIKTPIRPGDKIRVTYKGVVENDDPRRSSGGLLSYMDVDEDMWVLRVKTQVAEAVTYDLEVATIDRYAMDETRILVSALEALQAQNVDVKTMTVSYEKTYYDTVGNNGSGSRPARFRFRAKNTVVDVVEVRISFRTYPLDATTASIYLSPNYQLWWQLTDGYNYPSDVSLWINGVDVTSAFGPGGAEWNDGGVNAALDVQDLDITPYIEANGVHNETLIELRCGSRVGEVRFNSGYPSLVQSTASNGKVELTMNVTVQVRDLVPA